MEIHQPNTGAIIELENRFDVDRGLILEGGMTVRETGARWSSGGFFIETHPRHVVGTAIFAETRGGVQIGNLFPKGYGGVPDFWSIDLKRADLRADRRIAFRLLLRGGMLELCLDDRLIQCYSLLKKPTGRIGLVVESGRVVFEDVRAWTMSL